MFGNAEKFFLGEQSLDVDSTGDPTSQEQQIAAIAVLVEVACVDGRFAKLELDAVVNAVVSEFGVHHTEARGLVRIAEAGKMHPEKLDEFLEKVNQNFTVAQRQKLMTLAWKVISADGVVENTEAEVAAELRRKLDLSLEQGAAAQQQSGEG